MKKLRCFCLLALVLGLCLCLSSVRTPTRAEAMQTGYTLYLNENYPGAPPIGMELNVTTIVLPSPIRSGYRFLGWAESANGDVMYQAGESITLMGNLTLYAQWHDDS